MKHKHCEVIKAWAEGEIIEFYSRTQAKWISITLPDWQVNVEYRVKPKEWKEIFTGSPADCAHQLYYLNSHIEVKIMIR